MLKFKKSLLAYLLSALGVFAINDAGAGEVYVSGRALNGSSVTLNASNFGNGRSELIGSADCGGHVIGNQKTIGMNGGTAENRMVLQTIGGQANGSSYVESNGPGSYSGADLAGGSHFAGASLNSSAVSGPCGATIVRGRSFSEFGGRSDVNLSGYSAGFRGGRGEVVIDGYGHSFGPYTITDVRAEGVGDYGGYGGVSASGAAIGRFAPVQSRVEARSEGLFGGRSYIAADDFSIGQ